MSAVPPPFESDFVPNYVPGAKGAHGVGFCGMGAPIAAVIDPSEERIGLTYSRTRILFHFQAVNNPATQVRLLTQQRIIGLTGLTDVGQLVATNLGFPLAHALADQDTTAAAGGYPAQDFDFLFDKVAFQFAGKPFLTLLDNGPVDWPAATYDPYSGTGTGGLYSWADAIASDLQSIILASFNGIFTNNVDKRCRWQGGDFLRHPSDSGAYGANSDSNGFPMVGQLRCFATPIRARGNVTNHAQATRLMLTLTRNANAAAPLYNLPGGLNIVNVGGAATTVAITVPMDVVYHGYLTPPVCDQVCTDTEAQAAAQVAMAQKAAADGK